MDFPEEHKEYVKVRADFMPDGCIIPLMFKTEDGQKTVIDRVGEVRMAPALKAVFPEVDTEGRTILVIRERLEEVAVRT